MYFYIKSILLYKDQVCVLKVLWTGMGGVGGDLVQRRRRNKGWSGFMHQVKYVEMENGI